MMISVCERCEHRDMENASGYASTRQMAVDISAISSEYKNTSLYTVAFSNDSSEKRPFESVKA